MNAAKSTYEISPQASIYIPVAIPATPFPPYLHLDRHSEWHTSALLSMVLESMTLPSRLRPGQGRRGLLDDLAMPLNVNGNQRIAALQCSIPKAAKPDSHDVNLLPADNDQRVPGSNTSEGLHGGNDLQQTNARFDLDLSCGETASSAFGPIHHKASEHVFGRVDCSRDPDQSLPEINGEDDGVSRKRRRLAGVPIIERSVTQPAAVQACEKAAVVHEISCRANILGLSRS